MAVPSLLATSHWVRCNIIGVSVFRMFKHTFLTSERMKSTIRVHSGADAFASPDFAALFERSALPADVGGTLTSGADGKCCRGVDLPAVSDAEAVWRLYEGLLSPSVQAQVAKHIRTASTSISNPTLTPAESALTEAALFLPNELETARTRHRSCPKAFACYLCRHSNACAAEARLLKKELETTLKTNVFLGKCFAVYMMMQPRQLLYVVFKERGAT